MVENQKLRKYDLLANEVLIHKSSTRIVPCVMTWDGVVTKYHKKHIKGLEIQPHLEAYIQSIVLKKTLESISLDRRRGYGQEDVGEEEVDRKVRALVGTIPLDTVDIQLNNDETNIKNKNINNTTESKDCEGNKLEENCSKLVESKDSVCNK